MRESIHFFQDLKLPLKASDHLKGSQFLNNSSSSLPKQFGVDLINGEHDSIITATKKEPNTKNKGDGSVISHSSFIIEIERESVVTLFSHTGFNKRIKPALDVFFCFFS